MKYQVNTNDDTNLLEELEKELLFFSNEYVVNKWRIPALISEDVLRKCGYFDTMPNQLTIAGFFDKSEYTGLARESSEVKSCRCEKMYFTPAACIHFYPELENKVMKNELITTNARVYRHEDGNFSSARLWDFNVREFVAIGSVEFVNDFLEDFMKKSLLLAQKYDNKCRIEVANDHFFPSRENKIKEMVQKANKMKYELLDSNDVAIASFNFHGYHFSKTFNFDNEGEIVSGCVGFGLDRWLRMLKGDRDE